MVLGGRLSCLVSKHQNGDGFILGRHRSLCGITLAFCMYNIQPMLKILTVVLRGQKEGGRVADGLLDCCNIKGLIHGHGVVRGRVWWLLPTIRIDNTENSSTDNFIEQDKSSR